MSSKDEASSGFPDAYQQRLQQIGENSRTLLAKYQEGDNALISGKFDVTNFSESSFPRSSLESIRDSALTNNERHELATYLLGCWYIDQVDGAWFFVPMPVEQPLLYLNFGIGIRTPQGAIINVAESAREIIEGSDMSFKEAMYTANVKVEKRSPGGAI